MSNNILERATICILLISLWMWRIRLVFRGYLLVQEMRVKLDMSINFFVEYLIEHSRWNPYFFLIILASFLFLTETV